METEIRDMESAGREKGIEEEPLARVLHPEFGLFWPSPRFLRKLCIVTAFVAGGVIVGTQGILLLSNEEEHDARSAFALAPPASSVIPPGSGAEIEKTVRSPATPLQPATVTPPLRAEPKIIRVERKPIQSVEISSERKTPTAPTERAGPLAAAPAVPTSAPTLAEHTTPAVPAELSRTPPETLVTAVPTEAVAAPVEVVTPRPAASPSRKVHRSATRSPSDNWRSYSYRPAARAAGGYGALW
jgi:hypothetical protein